MYETEAEEEILVPVQPYVRCPSCKKLSPISHNQAENLNSLVGYICLKCGYQLLVGDTVKLVLKG